MSEIGSPTSFSERAFYESGLYDGSIAERRAIVEWLRADVDLGEREARFIAGCIENGVHLAGDDE